MTEPHSDESKRHNVRAWVRMAMWIAGAVLLAYGVVRVPSRSWLSGRGPGATPARPVKLLLTSFEKFGKSTDNASRVMVAAAAESLRTRPPEDRPVELDVLTLPVVYGAAEKALEAEIDKFSPDLVIAFGEAGGGVFRLEIQAFNLDDAELPDNAGVVLRKTPIVQGGPPRYLSRLPVHDMQRRLKAADYPAVISYSAGNYLCNHLFYQLERYTTAVDLPKARQRMSGFVHVPALPADGSQTYESWGKWGGVAVRAVVESTLAALPR